jgi:hypothetical protein
LDGALASVSYVDFMFGAFGVLYNYLLNNMCETQLYMDTMHLLFVVWIISIVHLCIKLSCAITKGHAKKSIFLGHLQFLVTNRVWPKNRPRNQQNRPVN